MRSVRLAVVIVALSSLALVGALAGASPGWAQAQPGEAPGAPEARPGPAPEEAFVEALERANAAYNGGSYDQALQGYIQAVQIDPRQAEPYRNMARAYFWQGDYDAALAYYDTYLVNFPQVSDADQIQRERRLASERASTPWTLPEGQRVAMRALESGIEQGQIYTRGGGGAWKAYQSLLRTGYAQPGLLRLRERLVRRLLEEFDGLLESPPGQPSPSLSLEAWELQRERIEAASRLALDQARRDEIARRELIVQAALALMMSRFEDAASRAEAAAAQNPERLFLRWFHVTALLRANHPEQALRQLEVLEPMLRQRAPAQLRYLEVVRAMILQRLGRHNEAGDLYIGLFRE